jgi:hypothetical protein
MNKKNQKKGTTTTRPIKAVPAPSPRERFYKLVPQHYKLGAFFEHFTAEFNKTDELGGYRQAKGTSVVFLNPDDKDDDKDDFEALQCRCFLNERTSFKVLHLKGTNLEEYVGEHCYLVSPPQNPLDEDWIQRARDGKGSKCCQSYGGIPKRDKPCKKPFEGFALRDLLLSSSSSPTTNEPMVQKRGKILVLDLVSDSSDDDPPPPSQKPVNRKRGLSLPQDDQTMVMTMKKSQKTHSTSSPSPVMTQVPIAIADLDALLDLATQETDPMDDLMDVVLPRQQQQQQEHEEFDDLKDVVPPPPLPPPPLQTLLDVMVGPEETSTLSPFPLLPLAPSFTTATLTPPPTSLLGDEDIEEEFVIEEGLLAPMDIDPLSVPHQSQHPDLMEASAEEVQQWQASISSSSLNTTQAVSPPSPPPPPTLSHNSSILQPVSDRDHRTQLLAQKLSGHHEGQSFSYATLDKTFSLSVSSGDALFSLLSRFPAEYQRQMVHNIFTIPNAVAMDCLKNDSAACRLPALSTMLTLTGTAAPAGAVEDMTAFRIEDMQLQNPDMSASLSLYPGFLAILLASDKIRISYSTTDATSLALELWTHQQHEVLLDDTLIYLNPGLHLLYLRPTALLPRLNLVVYAEQKPVHISIAGLSPASFTPIRMIHQHNDDDGGDYVHSAALTKVLEMAQRNRMIVAHSLTPPSPSPPPSPVAPSLHAALFGSLSESVNGLHSQHDFSLALSQGDIDDPQSSFRPLIDLRDRLRIVFVDDDPSSIHSPAFYFTVVPPDPSITVLLYEKGIVVSNGFAMELNLTCASITSLTESNGEPKLSAYSVRDNTSPLYELFQRFKRLSKQYDNTLSVEKKCALAKDILKVSTEMWGNPVSYLRVNQTGLFSISFNNKSAKLRKPLRTSTIVTPSSPPPPPPPALLQ